MGQFSFEFPFLLLLIIPFVLCAKWCKERSRAIYFPHVQKLVASSIAKSSLLLWLKWFGVVSAVIALASPVLTHNYTNSKKEGRDIVLITDASESMLQRGFDVNNPTKNKFETVQEVVEDFIRKRENDRIGLVSFGAISFIASPLTFEKEFLEKIISMQHIGMINGRRTAIQDALVQSYNMMSKSKAKSKIAILLTDGVDNGSKIALDDVLEMIKKQDVKLYVIGIGYPNRDYDAAYLKALADAGGTKAYGARDASELTAIYEQIDTLEVTKIDDKRVVQYTYLYIYPLLAAVLSLLGFIYLRNSRGV
jgi:Ca-activated chloride channel family protein